MLKSEMGLHLIIGPMKSGKSLELIARVAPYEFAEKKVLYVQTMRDVRDEGIKSRIGINTRALRVNSLREVTNGFDVIGVDEVHMFDESDVTCIKKWLDEGKEVFVSGLDLDYRATLTPPIRRIMELKPDNIISKVAVCDVCHSYSAQFTQILLNSQPVLGGMSHIVPEDGTFVYEARCRNCYIHPDSQNILNPKRAPVKRPVKQTVK